MSKKTAKPSRAMIRAVMSALGARGGAVGGLTGGKAKVRGDSAYYEKLSRKAARARAKKSKP